VGLATEIALNNVSIKNLLRVLCAGRRFSAVKFAAIVLNHSKLPAILKPSYFRSAQAMEKYFYLYKKMQYAGHFYVLWINSFHVLS